MASIDLEYNSGFQIYNSDGTPFHDLVLHKCTYETVVMSLGDKISGILYYKDNALDVTMSEYIIYKGVRYTLVNPPTILREGLVSDNGELKGMTKYSFTFYHPMYVLNNFSFNDVAVSSDQNKYLSQNKTFSWIGNLNDYVAKINKNLQGTEWFVKVGDNVTQEEKTKLSDVLSFDKNTIAEALKRGYETWEVPYIVDSIHPNEYLYVDEHNVQRDYYDDGKRFVVLFGLPTTEITVKDDNDFETPYVFKMGQGVGLKNNSRNPKNNKIITRIAGYGSEDNIPYGYPQIRYYGGNVQYPLYYGIVGGQRVQLIKHPFTRNHLMPSVYSQAVYNKVNPKLSDGSNNPNYNPNIELVDYYDADSTYTNPIKSGSPSYEIHEFGDIKPELGEEAIINAVPVNAQETQSDYKQKSDFLQEILNRISSTDIDDEKVCLKTLYDKVDAGLSYYAQKGEEGGSEYWYRISVTSDDYYQYVSYESGNYNFTATVLKNDSSAPTPEWDDTMDDDGNYLQSYFKITLPILSFDLYACAAITQEMKINMRSGACIGCTFPVQVDWDDYKRNFYNSDGEFAPDGEQRDYTKYPDSSSGQITVMVKKELETFGTLMPNQYQQPTTGDKFVILGISLPESYITNAEQRLDTDMKQYMRDNNVYYYEYPLKFDEHFLISNENILSQMKPNVVVRFEYAGETHALYIKQMSVKYNESPLPKYDITLTDDIEIVLNQIGQVTDEVSKLRLGLGENGIGGNGQEYLRKDIDDTARGTIRMIKGMQVGERFVTGLLGEGGVFRKDVDGTTYLETDKLYVRMKAYFDTVEVKHYLHTGGNRIASQASGIVCSRVEYINNNGDVTTDLGEAILFRCYFKANDGDKTIRNDFMIGDLAFCRETNVDVSEVNMHGYWRLVIGRNGNGSLTENKEGWIDLSNRVSETLTIDGKDYVCNGYQNGSDAPIAQDDIIQLGNIANTDRQGAIVEYVGGEDAPSYQIFQGIGSDLPYPYTLENKNYIGIGYSSQTGRAYMNVYGDAYIGDPDGSTFIKYEQEDSQTHQPKMTIRAVVEFQSPDDPTQTTTLEQFASTIVGDIENIQSQIDGEIDTWFYAGVPTLQNAPANEWTTDVEKEKHAGDLYYDIGTGTDAGKAYRFVRSQNKPYVYSWQYIDDTAITEALRIAAHAQDTADHKRRVFVTQPLPPYDIGDLWSDAVYPSGNTEKDSENGKYYKDLLTCKVAKEEGESFSISDWGLTTNYTDDSAFNKFFADTYQPFVTQIQEQVDGKAETWYQSTDPSAAWNTPELKQTHVGDIWHNTSSATVSGVEAGQDAIWSGSEWKPSTVPQEVYDKIDGKASIYTDTLQDPPTNYKENDLWIIPADYTINGVAYKKGEVLTATSDSVGFNQAHWTKKVRYTDDSSLNDFKANKYVTQLTNGTISTNITNAQSAAQAAEAHAATLDYVKTALKQDTIIDGGLVISTLLAMRDGNNKIWSGINGAYNSAETGTGYKGHGIASWYGGAMVDKEVTTTATDYAKSLFRFDGSGYLAGGNITWDKNGIVTIANVYANIGGTDTSLTGTLQTLTNLSNALPLSLQSGVTYLDPKYGFTNLSVLGKPVATQEWVGHNYLSIAFFKRLFQAHNGSANVNPNDTTTTITDIEAMFGFWTKQYISTLGKNDSGGSSGTGDVTWDLLASNSDTRQIALSHLTTALSGYATQGWVIGQGFLKSGSLSNYVTLNTAQTITGAKTFSGSIATNGGITPLGVGTVNTASGGSKVYFKRVSNTEAPNNGVVIEYGNSTSWVGQLYLGDNATQGLYWNGWSNGVRGEWKKFAFTDEIVSNIGNGSITNVMLANNSVTINGTSVDLGGSVTTTKWGTARTITIADNTNTNTQTNTNIDGGANFTLKLPATIKAALTGNADTATKLATERTLTIGSKGYTFDGSKDVTWTLDDMDAANRTLSNLSSITDHTSSDAEYYPVWYNGTSKLYTSKADLHYNPANKRLTIGSALAVGNSYLTGGGQLRIGASTLAYHITMGVGTSFVWFDARDAEDKMVNAFQLYPEYANFQKGIRATKFYLRKPNTNNDNGAVYLEYNSTNSGVHLVGAGFYADTYISALGKSSGGSDSGVDMATVWSALSNATTEQINASHLTNALAPYATQSWVNQQISAHTPDLSGYLKLSGGVLTGDLLSKRSNFDLSKSDNGVENTIYPTTFNILDSGGRISARLENTVLPNGDNGFYLYARQYNAEGSLFAQKGISYGLTKAGVGTWNVSDAPAFRTALGLGTRATDSTDYLPLSGGTMTGGLNFRFGHDLTQENNGVTSVGYYGIRMYDKNNHLSAQFINQVNTNGNNQININLRNRNGSTEYDKSFLITLTKSGVISASLGGAFTANSFIKSGGTASQFLKADGSVDGNTYALNSALTNYLHLTNGGTVTGAVALNGGITPLDAGNVNTPKGDGKVYFKRASNSASSDAAPHNGVVIECGYSTSWAGQLLITDTNNQGLYWNGWSQGTRGTWKKIAFTTDNVATATALQTTRTIWGQNFNGTQNVSGIITNASGLVFNNTGTGFGYIDFYYASSSSLTSNIYESASGNLQINSILNVKRGGNVGIGTASPSYKLHVNGTFYASGNSSIGGTFGVTGATTLSSTLGVTGATTLSSTLNVSGNVGIGTASPSTSLHVVGRVTCEYDSTKSGSFRAIRGDYATWYGINSSGFAMITTAQKDASSSTVRIMMTPYTAQEQYIMFGKASNFIMGTTISGSTSTYRDGAYIQIGGARIVWDNANTALKVVKSDGTTAANFYATGAVSALGANASGGSGSGIDANWLKTNDVEIKRLGIGVAPSSSYQLNVQGASNFTGAVAIHNALTVNSGVSAVGGFSTSQGSISAAHNITAGGNGLIHGRLTVGQSTVNTSYNLYVKGSSLFDGNVGIGGYNDTYNLYVSGNAYVSSGIYLQSNVSIKYSSPTYGVMLCNIAAPSGLTVNGSTSWSSDMRKKDVVSYVNDLDVNKVAKAPVFRFTWKDKRDSVVRVGSSAQYWQNALANSVMDMGEYGLMLDYNAITIASAVVTARKVVDHELRIKQLEQENAILREEIKSLKAA